MSSCFLCDCSYKFAYDERHEVVFSPGVNALYYMRYRPIMIGSSGTNVDDQQHENNKKQNYVSYRVKKIEFRASCIQLNWSGNLVSRPDYVLIFKVPFREPVFDYYFTVLNNFMLYSEPESVLKYGVYSVFDLSNGSGTIHYRKKRPNEYCLIVDKPFIVGPNDYVGVLYMFKNQTQVDASAKVWFDVV